VCVCVCVCVRARVCVYACLTLAALRSVVPEARSTLFTVESVHALLTRTLAAGRVTCLHQRRRGITLAPLAACARVVAIETLLEHTTDRLQLVRSDLWFEVV